MIVERRIGNRVWLEYEGECFAPVHAALWFYAEEGWLWADEH